MPKNTVDFVEAEPVTRALLGDANAQLSLGSVLSFYEQHKQMINEVIRWIRTRFSQRHPQAPLPPTPGVPPPVPIPVPPPIPPTSAPGPAVPALYTAGLRIGAIRPGQHPFPGIFFIERNNKSTSHGDYLAICSGEQPLNSGVDQGGERPDAVHLNFDTMDQNGHKLEGGAEDIQALLRYELCYDDGSFRVQVRVINQGPVDLTSDYDDYAMTPVLRVHPNLPLSVEQHVASAVILEGTTRSGAALSASVDLSRLRIKPWQR